jgi:hypothetical protein
VAFEAEMTSSATLNNRASHVIPALALALGLTLNVSVQAATLGDVAVAMAAPSSAAQSTNDWTSLAKLKGAKWKGSAPAKGGNTYYWNGETTFDGLGPGHISASGPKAAVMTITATVNKKIDLAKASQLMAQQFPKEAKLEQIRGACPGEVMSGSRIYRVTLAGLKPLYVHLQSVTEDRGGSYTSFDMEPLRNKLWIC